MREFISKLLDEENRQADIVAFGQLVSLAVAVLTTLLLLVPAAISVVQTGKIDPNAVWIVTVWLGSAATFGVADSRRPQTPPAPPVAPTAPQPPQPPQPSASPQPQPQPQPVAMGLPPAPGQPGGRTAV